MRCDNDSGKRHVRHAHGNVNRAETVDTVNSKAAREMTGIVNHDAVLQCHDLVRISSAQVCEVSRLRGYV